VLMQPGLASDPRFALNPARSQNRQALRAIIEEAFRPLTAAQVAQRLDDAQIANANVNGVGDLWSHPQLVARGRYRTVGSPAGDLRALLPPGVNSSYGYRMDPVPAVGEHSEAILRELGRGDADVARLRGMGAI